MKPIDEVLLQPLLRLSPLQPGESLPSLLARLAILNYYDSPSIMHSLADSEWADCPSRAVTFRRLQVLTGIAASDLYAASDHSLVITRPVSDLYGWRPFDPAKGVPYWSSPPVRGSVHLTQASRFCPHCLTNGAYHRLAWKPMPMAVCLVHDCLLAEACPQCSSRISIRDIVLLRCAHCQFDLRQANAPSILNETWEHTAQKTLWAWLTGQSTIDHNMGWPSSSLPVLCNLAEGLARAMLVFPERFHPHPFAPTSPLKVLRNNHTLNHLPSSVICWAYTSALKWMVNWPEGFREFIHHCAPDPESTLKSALGFFHISWICKRWNNDKFTFIQEALDTFRLDRTWFAVAQPKLDVSFERAFTYANLKEAAQILQTPDCVVHRLGQMGLIHTVGRSFNTFCLRSDLRAVKRRWIELLSLEETAEWLGVTPEIVLGLSKEHTLKVEHNPEQAERRAIFFTRNSVAKLLDRVNSQTSDLDHQEGLISLAEAAHQLNCIHLNEARLLKRVLSRSLRAWRNPVQRDDWGVGEISFTQKNIDAILNEVVLSRDWRSADEVSANLGVEEDVFLGWIERGFLKLVIVYNGEPYLRARQIEKFSTEYIFEGEAQKLLDISRRRLLGYIRRGKLKPVAGPDLDGCPRYLLLRKKVERLAKRLKNRKSSVCLIISETQSHYI